MIAILRNTASEQEVNHLISWIEKKGLADPRFAR